MVLIEPRWFSYHHKQNHNNQREAYKPVGETDTEVKRTDVSTIRSPALPVKSQNTFYLLVLSYINAATTIYLGGSPDEMAKSSVCS